MIRQGGPHCFQRRRRQAPNLDIAMRDIKLAYLDERRRMEYVDRALRWKDEG